ncbi:hypothetical protein QWY31_05585 [Cytophagales bacterium LB-30]|uniref:Outer membrane protein beta-barrel domain-containing protein n=1 Tax=Shiella aurantiaca TaxID=3058365 RepID=A0ABT8F3K8_9BACT|nr:hypothetical protein [Shiella aurantiaca]MDN4164963.1 hypothetical protein [Shiella aurantiaca]
MRYFLFFLCLSIGPWALAQDSTSVAGDTSKVVFEGFYVLEGGISQVAISEFDPRFIASLDLSYHFRPHAAILYNYGFMQNYFHFGLGSILGPLGLMMLRSEDLTLGQLFFALLFTASSVESMGFPIPIGTDKEIMPYYSALKIRSMWDGPDTPGLGTYASWSLGVKARHFFNYNWHISGYVEYTQLYFHRLPRGTQAGIQVGYSF